MYQIETLLPSISLIISLPQYLYGPLSCFPSAEKPGAFFPRSSWPLKNPLFLTKNGRKQAVITVEPPFNDVPRDWEQLFVVSRVHYDEHLDLTKFRKNNQNVRHIKVYR